MRAGKKERRREGLKSIHTFLISISFLCYFCLVSRFVWDTLHVCFVSHAMFSPTRTPTNTLTSKYHQRIPVAAQRGPPVMWPANRDHVVLEGPLTLCASLPLACRQQGPLALLCVLRCLYGNHNPVRKPSTTTTHHTPQIRIKIPTANKAQHSPSQGRHLGLLSGLGKGDQKRGGLAQRARRV